MTNLTRTNEARTQSPAPFLPSITARPLSTRKDIVEINRAERAAQETDLVARLLVDDPEAWRFFTSEYSRIVIGCIRRVLARFTRVTSDHDVDEVYARFCFELLANDRKKLRCFDPEKGGRLSTWIGLLAKNATYDYLRRLKRDRVCEPLPETDTLQSEEENPFEQVVLQQRAAITSATLRRLSDRDRQFVDLYFAQGMEAEAIAEIMNISVKTVYTKRHKITARLEAMLTAQA
jgi:RNA polymerase sigma-70 factor (ECF subfamily)